MNHDPLAPHSHDPNPEPPSADPTIRLTLPNGNAVACAVDYLAELPQESLTDCYIVSTGHATTGPFTFRGPTLLALIEDQLERDQAWSTVEVISGDGFGTRVQAPELTNPETDRPIILALFIDGEAMPRADGLVRLIVPSETDDALRQVKWIGAINIL